LSQNKNSIQNNKCRKIICKAKRKEWGWEENKIITEHRQTGGITDGENIVGMRMGTKCGDEYKIFYPVIL